MAALADLAAEMLEEATDALADPPERRYVAHSEPSWDCEQLSVHVVRVRPKLIDPRSRGCMVSLVAGLAVVLLRCYPTVEDGGPNGPQFPAAAEIDEVSLALAADGEAVLRHFTRAWANREWPDGVPCTEVEFAPLEPLAPSGGLAGWRLMVEVQL